jgi:hypothetical protein
MPRPEQIEKMAADVEEEAARGVVRPRNPISEAYWAAILQDPRAESQVVPIQNCRLSDIARHVLRVSCRRCDRIVEIQRSDAVRLYGGHTVWKDVGRRLLDNGCQERTGSCDDDGCWPSYGTC